MNWLHGTLAESSEASLLFCWKVYEPELCSFAFITFTEMKSIGMKLEAHVLRRTCSNQVALPSDLGGVRLTFCHGKHLTFQSIAISELNQLGVNCINAKSWIFPPIYLSRTTREGSGELLVYPVLHTRHRSDHGWKTRIFNHCHTLLKAVFLGLRL